MNATDAKLIDSKIFGKTYLMIFASDSAAEINRYVQSHKNVPNPQNGLLLDDCIQNKTMCRSLTIY